MDKNLTGEFNKDAIDLWNWGLLRDDPVSVARALECGVDVNTPWHFGMYLNPVASYISMREHLFNLEEHIGEDADNRRSTIFQIVDLLLAKEPDLLEKDNWGTCAADKCISFEDCHEVAAHVAIAAIHQSIREGQSVYQMDIEAMFADCGADPLSRTTLMNNIEETHDFVRSRLLNPKTPVEIDLVENHSEKIGFWLTPFVQPDLSTLPVRSDTVDNALGDFIGAAGDAFEAVLRGDMSGNELLKKVEESLSQMERTLSKDRKKPQGPQ